MLEDLLNLKELDVDGAIEETAANVGHSRASFLKKTGVASALLVGGGAFAGFEGFFFVGDFFAAAPTGLRAASFSASAGGGGEPPPSSSSSPSTFTKFGSAL